MARCVLSLINQDLPDEGMACMVHTHYAPCPRDGEPANPEPIHSDDHLSRASAIGIWKIRSGGQRSLLIHHGALVDGTHKLWAGCWCKPEALTAAEVSA